MRSAFSWAAVAEPFAQIVDPTIAATGMVTIHSTIRVNPSAARPRSHDRAIGLCQTVNINDMRPFPTVGLASSRAHLFLRVLMCGRR